MMFLAWGERDRILTQKEAEGMISIREKLKIINILLLMAPSLIGLIFVPVVIAQTSESPLDILIRTVDNLNLDDYVNHRLFVKLDVVEKSIEAGHYRPAIENMNAFKTEVGVIQKISAKTGRNFLTNQQADILLGLADVVLAAIGNASASVGTDGGTISVSDPSVPISGSSVEIPQGAIDTDTVITITQDIAAPVLPSNLSNAGPAVDFGPSGLTFATPVTISVPYNRTSNATNVKLMSFSGDQWVQVPISEINTSKKIVFAQVSHFSTYQAAEETGDPNAPVFNWIDLLNINSAGNSVIAMGCSVSDPNGPAPDSIRSLTLEAPDGSVYYQFIEGDYLYRYTSLESTSEYYWRFIRLWIPSDPLPAVHPPSGTYKFSVTNVNNVTTEQIVTLNVEPIPVVDNTTVQISRDGSNWIPQANSGFDQVNLNGQSLWVKWQPLNSPSNPLKSYYYRVLVRNRTGAVLYKTDLVMVNMVEIPIEILNTILHDRSFYNMRIEVFDATSPPAASNKSESVAVPFTTGDLGRSEPVIDWAVVLKNSFYSNGQIQDHLQANFTFLARETPDLSKFAVSVTLPPSPPEYPYKTTYAKEDYVCSANNVAKSVNCYLSSPPVSAKYGTGKVLFKVSYREKDYFFEDFFNNSRTISPPVPISGGDTAASAVTVSIPPTLTWYPTLSGKTYELRIQATNGTLDTYSPWLTPVLQLGQNTILSYEVSSALSPGTTYGWQVRAYEGTSWGEIDGRGSSVWKYFKYQPN
jgi:hypothetical protein